MHYLSDYANEVKQGLERMLVTDVAGRVLDIGVAFSRWSDCIQDSKEKNGTFFFCGNGASCTMAEHLSHDCFQNANMNTYTVSETAHLTAISNDLSYDDVFAYRIGRIGKENDVLITISSSGNSPNIIKAIKAAREKGLYIVTISGKGAGNMSRELGDINFYVPLQTYGLVESAHAVLLHSLLDSYLDKHMGGRH